ncbi:MAG: DUF2281 domain-containing protein [Eubacteriales bacterium]|nr:DUF2281 domain-containing protein [Eubacteriales bacterium]
MSILEKTIHLLSELPENQIEVVYHYIQFLTTKQRKFPKKSNHSEKEKALSELKGCVPDTGKSLEEYREERMRERYGVY